MVNNNITIFQIFNNRLYSLGVHSGKGYAECNNDISLDDIELSYFFNHLNLNEIKKPIHINNHYCWKYKKKES